MRVRRLTTEAFLWVLGFSVYVAALVVRHQLFRTTSCELLASTSNYGEPGWTWFPPGTTCTYTVWDGHYGTTFTTGPGPWTYVLPTLLSCWAFSILRRRRVWRVIEIEDELAS